MDSDCSDGRRSRGLVMAQCSFCSEEAHGPCAWPVERWVEREASELVPGEIVRRHKENEADAAHTIRVDSVSKLDEMLLRVVVVIKPKSGEPLMKMFETNTFQLVRVLRKVPCGALACENHLAARGPGIYNCRDHWMAWENVA